MKMSSMDILMHRYFDGDLSPEESEAFLNDVAANPALMERMESEAQLNMAVIDDAYTLEPPEAVRTAVLDSVLASRSASHTSFAWFRGAITGVLVMFSVVLPTSGPIQQSTPVSSTPPVVKSTTQPPQVQTQRTQTGVTSEPRVQQTIVVDVAESRPEEAPGVTALSMAHPLAAPPATMALRSVPDGVDRPTRMASFAPSPFHLLDGVGGVVSPTTVSLRLSIAASERLGLFTELGSTQLTQEVTQFENNVRQQTLQNSTGAFAALGVTYSVPIHLFGDRSVSASAAIGMSRAGAFGRVDLSLDLLSVNAFILEAGARMSGGPDLRSTVEPMMMVRVRL
jgi:hypothetical protein